MGGFILNAFQIQKNSAQFNLFWVKGALSGLRQFLAAESLLKMMKNASYFTSKTLSFCLFGHVVKRLDKENKVNFKFYDVTAWLTNNSNTHVVQYLEK